MTHHQHAAARDIGVVRERDRRDARRLSHGAHGGHIFGQQRTEDQAVAIRNSLAHGSIGALRGVIGCDAQIARIGINQCHGRRICQRLPNRSGVARCRHQQSNAVARLVGRQLRRRRGSNSRCRRGGRGNRSGCTRVRDNRTPAQKRRGPGHGHGATVEHRARFPEDGCPALGDFKKLHSCRPLIAAPKRRREHASP